MSWGTNTHRHLHSLTTAPASRLLGPAVAALFLSACGGGTQDASSDSQATRVHAQALSPAMATAMSTGNAAGVTRAQVQAEMATYFSTQRNNYAALKQALFGLNADGTANAGSVGSIDWNPGTSSILLSNLDSSENFPALPVNWSYAGNAADSSASVLALVGTMPSSTARHAVFGGHPFAVPGNAAMDQFLGRTVSWLTRRTSFTGFKVVVAQQASGQESATRNWLASHYAGVTINGVATNAASQPDNRCDNAALDGCLQGADLLVVGHDLGTGYDGAVVMQAINAAQLRGVPVLFTQGAWSTSDLTARVLDAFHIANPYVGAGNYFSTDGLKAFAPASLPASPGNLADIQALVNRLDTGSFSTTWSGCTSSLGKTSCSGDTAYMGEFGTTAAAIRATMRSLDGSAHVIFGQGGYTLEKYLALLGDLYRVNVSYSTSFTKESDKAGFLRAMFSDAASYSSRGYTLLAHDLGDFSGMFPASTATLTRTVTVARPVQGSTDYATGLYILPGRRVTITRTDAGTGAVRFGVNMLRDTTRPFDKLDRPTQLASPRPALLPNVPVMITNPYGGPLYLFVDAASGQPPVSVKVSGVITHPVLRDANDPAQVAAFTAAVDATPTNWVVTTSDTMTVHSTLDHFRQSIANPSSGAINYGGDIGKMSADTWTYTTKDTYELAGFNSASGQLVLPATVTTFCAAKGWDCTGPQHRRDTMQHVISDVWALCGAGCAGNPYDEDWAFEPLGWGETHEIGHNLQRERTKIYGGISAEVSNNIFPVHKRIHYNRDQGRTVFTDRATIGSEQPLCTDHSLSVGACVFSLMKSAQAQPDPSATVKQAIWSDTAYATNNSERVMFYRQLVEYARHYRAGTFTDGWELHTLMYLLERDLTAASSTWTASKDGLGFGTYASYPSTMNGNDFMVISASSIVGRDMRPVFDLWGITYSAAASAQVAAYGLPTAGKLFFPMASLSASGTGVGTPVVVTSTASYPTGY